MGVPRSAATVLTAAESLVEALRARGETLAVAESCTGGLLGAHLTSVPGSSEVFWGGAISYDDGAKRELLGVSDRALREHGAVSREVALEMARGIRARAGTTWSIAVTGIAGPAGGSRAKPVGTVWIAVDGPTGSTRLHRFAGDRDGVREATVNEAMNWLASCVVKVDREADDG